MRIFAVVATLLLTIALPAMAEEQTPADTTKVPSYWKKGLLTQVGFSQLSLTNWAAGGTGSLSLNTYLDGYTNYKKDKIIWNNELQLGYGFIQQFDGTKLKKSDDRIILDSKFGYKATEKLYFSAIFNFRSQFADGFDEKETDKLVSTFFAPAYLTLGIGLDYQPWKVLSLNFAPITGKLIMVSNKDLRESYGNKADQFCRFDIGAQIKADFKYEISSFVVGSNLTLFSDYIDSPLDIRVNWDVNIDAKISNLFAVTLRTSLIYDKDIKCKKQYDEKGDPVLDPSGKQVMVPGIQFKEIFSVGFSYTFGQAK